MTADTAPPSYITVDAVPSRTSEPSQSQPTTPAAITPSVVSSAAPPAEPSAPITADTETSVVEVPASSPSVEPAFDPATLAELPAPDPEVPGADSGVPCASDPTYTDEDPTGLDENVVTAWRAVEAAANGQGLVVCLNDGKRSRAQQQATYDEYVRQYGQATADQYVLTPDKSAHVKGYAIDVQPAAAFNWLEQSNGVYGFCRTYDNEAWHFEFDRSFAASGCPARLPAPVR